MSRPLARFLFACCCLLISPFGEAHAGSVVGDATDTGTADSWVTWDPASEGIISAPQDAGAAAPRARQLANGEILLAYHHGEALGNCGSRVTLRHSRDGGATWYRTQEVEGPEPGFWGFSNPGFRRIGQGARHAGQRGAGQGGPPPPPTPSFPSASAAACGCVSVTTTAQPGARPARSPPGAGGCGNPPPCACPAGSCKSSTPTSRPICRRKGPAVHRGDPLAGRRADLDRATPRVRAARLPPRNADDPGVEQRPCSLRAGGCGFNELAVDFRYVARTGPGSLSSAGPVRFRGRAVSGSRAGREHAPGVSLAVPTGRGPQAGVRRLAAFGHFRAARRRAGDALRPGVVSLADRGRVGRGVLSVGDGDARRDGRGDGVVYDCAPQPLGQHGRALDQRPDHGAMRAGTPDRRRLVFDNPLLPAPSQDRG